MGEYTAFANYILYFRDQAEYEAALVLAGGNYIQTNPANAATIFGMDFPPDLEAVDLVKGIYASSNNFYSFIEPGNEIHNPAPTGVFLSPSQDDVLVPPQENPGDEFSNEQQLRLVWLGQIVKAGGSTGAEPDPAEIAPIPQRRWLGGVEYRPQGEGGTGITTSVGCRDSSRTIDGIGFPIRGNNNSNEWDRRNDEFRPGLTTRESWERLYIRIRAVGGVAVQFWRSHGTSDLSGAVLKVNTDRTVSVFNQTNVGAQTLLGTSSALELNTWYLLDIITKYSAGVAEGRIRVFFNHTAVFDFSVLAGGGLAQTNQFHIMSSIGRGTADVTQQIDLDDWICADVPQLDGTESLTSMDWQTGSHVRKHNVLSAVHTNWAGGFQALNQGQNPNQAQNSALVSTTSGATITAETDYVDEQSAIGLTLGPVAFLISLFSAQVGSTDGELGYSILGGAPVLITIDQSAAENWDIAPYIPTDLQFPEAIAPLQLIHTKSADANSSTVEALTVAVEYIGVWGLEDDPENFDTPRITLLHNCQYGNTPWAFVGPIPNGPCAAIGGTYVGNSLFQDIDLLLPAHFLWIRPVVASPNPVSWLGVSLGGRVNADETTVPNYPVRVWVDANGQAKFSVNGSNAQINASGITYQYVAFCDPAMRYNLCGAYNHPGGTEANVLIDAEFEPIAGFITQDLIGGSSATDGFSYKGPGHGANDGTNLDGTAIASWGSFALGLLNTLSGTNFVTASQASYSLWRTDDTSGNVMVQIYSYIGDGTGNRTVASTPVSGRFPLLAIVVPHGGTTAVYRDPSHTGTDSSNVSDGTTVTTGIRGGGIDTLDVGTSLNALGVVYDVFIIPGSNLGWDNGDFYPPSIAPPGTQWVNPGDLDPPDVGITGEGGLVLNGQPSMLLLKDISGIYTIVPGKTDDTLYDRQTGQTNVDVEIPDPTFKTGYVGG